MKSAKLYSNKQKWKIVLSVIALAIVFVSLWYTNYITRKIQKEERLRVKLWSETVKKQAQLVNLTNQTFDQLRVEERKNIELWGRALKEIARDQNDYTFVMSIVADNQNIPVISENIDYSKSIQTKSFDGHNLPFSSKDFIDKADFEDSLKSLAAIWDSINEPIRVANQFSQLQIIHYGNSKLFSELKAKSDSLISSFRNELIKNNALLPVIFIDSETREVIATNLPESQVKDRLSIEKIISQMESENEKIIVSLNDDIKGEIFYFESQTLKQLRYYPWIQIAIIGLFLLIAYFLFSTFRKAEQNQVWAGMAKETAHQLGTPLSSLMAWIELLRAQGVDDASLNEMNKDILRLNTITDRFSKIGSQVKLKETDVALVIENSIKYLEKRVSKKVALIQNGDKEALAQLNEPLFEWVIENLTKNAIDAITGEGSIIYTVTDDTDKVIIEVADTGKGIAPNKHKSIFNPGYTTKERGWGLGLSLVKRIVEEQLKGKIFVKWSEQGKGTTFRITLPKN